ncbi:MAG TPA: hypothetical protein VF245_06425 [Solirubrobacterales bacterium]
MWETITKHSQLGSLWRLSLCLIVGVLGSTTVIASFGPSTAFATVMCEEVTVESYCDTTYAYPSETTITSESSNSTWMTTLGTVMCSSSIMKGELTQEASEEAEKPLSAKLTEWAYSGCKLGKTSCTVEAEKLPYVTSLEWTSGYDASVHLALVSTYAKCGSLLNCHFGISEPTLTYDGGSVGSAKFLVSKVKMSDEGGKFLCPSEAIWSAEFQLAQPAGGRMYAGRQRLNKTVLCKEAQNPCPGAKIWSSGEKFDAELAGGEAEFKFEYNGAEKFVKCTTSEIHGEVGATGLPALAKISTLDFTGCQPCAVTSTRTPYRVTLEARKPPFTIGSDGVMHVESGGSGAPEFLFTCDTFTCLYRDSLLFYTVEGGNPAKTPLTSNSISLEDPTGEPLCLSKKLFPSFQAKYKFVNPNPMFLSRAP